MNLLCVSVLFFVLLTSGMCVNCDEGISSGNVIDRMLQSYSDNGSYGKLMEYGFPEISAIAAPRSPDIQIISDLLADFESLTDEIERDAVLDGIIGNNWSLISTQKIRLRGNINILKMENNEIDWEAMFAALISKSRQGRIDNIVIYLSLLDCYFGGALYAIREEDAVVSHRRVSMTDQQRLKFWPAVNVILSRSEETVPLLLEYVKQKDGNERNKLRAVSLLVEIDEKLVSDELFSGLDPDLVKKFQCIKTKKLNWRYVGNNPCVVPGISDEDRLILERRQRHYNKN